MRRWLLALALVLLAGRAAAHLMPQGQGAVRFDAQGVFGLVALPVRAFTGFDADGNGRMSPAEFERARPELLRQSAALLEFRADGQPGHLLVNQLLLPQAHELGTLPDSDYIVAMQRYVWDAPPREVTLHATQFARDPAPLLLAAVRGDASEGVMLTPGYDTHRFFAGPAAVLLRFIGLGAEHILFGFDHLLFLLTVLVVGAGWRYWASVVTSFTLAHSITLTLSALGWVAVPASVAEPMIAASIVLLAWDNLRRRGAPVRLARRSALVFACGLVHGMGFARALQELGGTGSRWLQLGGFNLGVELGQLLFVASVLAVLALVRRLRPAWTTPRIARATSWSAAGLGTLLLAHVLAG
jgi:hydrogenase/urease accessory protein HupE